MYWTKKKKKKINCSCTASSFLSSYDMHVCARVVYATYKDGVATAGFISRIYFQLLKQEKMYILFYENVKKYILLHLIYTKINFSHCVQSCRRVDNFYKTPCCVSYLCINLYPVLFLCSAAWEMFIRIETYTKKKP